MGIAQLVVVSNPLPGQEDEYNEWYSNRHLKDVLEVPGVVSATRLKLAGDPIGAGCWKYAALYTVDHDDPQSVLDELSKRSGTDRMPLSKALDLDGLYAAIYEPIVAAPPVGPVTR